MMKTKVIAIMNNKGGVGKTTTAVSLAAGLSRRNRQVLLVDTDPQGSVCVSFGIAPDTIETTIADSLTEGVSLPCYNVKENYYIVPSNFRLSMVEPTLYYAEDRVDRIAKILKPMLEAGDFDYIIIDCPPSFNAVNMSVLYASDYIIIPFKADSLSFSGLKNMEDFVRAVQMDKKSLTILGMLQVMYQYKDRKLSTKIRRRVEEQYPGMLFNTVIRDNVRIADAPEQGEDIFSCDIDCNGAKDYALFTQEVIDRCENDGR